MVMKITFVNLVHFVVPACVCLVFVKGTNLVRTTAVETVWAKVCANCGPGHWPPPSLGGSPSRMEQSAERIEKKEETMKYLLQ